MRVLCNLAKAVKPAIGEIIDVLIMNLGTDNHLLGRCRCAEVFPPPAPPPPPPPSLLERQNTSRSCRCRLPRRLLPVSRHEGCTP